MRYSQPNEQMSKSQEGGAQALLVFDPTQPAQPCPGPPLAQPKPSLAHSLLQHGDEAGHREHGAAAGEEGRRCGDAQLCCTAHAL